MTIETYLNQTKPKLEVATILNDDIGLNQTLLKCSIPCLPGYSCSDIFSQINFQYSYNKSYCNVTIKNSTIQCYLDASIAKFQDNVFLF